MNLSGKNILLGVTGGIAAYKSVFLLREFQKAGADVRVAMTPSATRFVGIETFSTLSRHEVAVEVFSKNDPGDSWTRHIHWSEWAGILVIAPCTANTLSKLVHGQADNMLTSVALAARCPILICPTMDAGMSRHPAVAQNLQLAETYGFHLLPPESGYLASGLEGSGRLPEPETILAAVSKILSRREPVGDGETGNQPHSKKKVLVTAGPTRERIDPVRFISNPSSGKMGLAMAEAARRIGGSVTLLHGPLEREIPSGIEAESFESAEDLFRLVRKHADADVVIMTAAVSDFRPAEPAGRKIKKESGRLSIELVPNPDCLAWLGAHKREGQILIGFAMETEELEKNAQAKLEKKNLDWICANDLTDEDAGFRSDTNKVLLLGPDSREHFRGTKREVAGQILDRIFQGR